MSMKSLLQTLLTPSENRTMVRWRGIFCLGLILGTSAAHYLTPLSIPQAHAILMRLYFFPLILAAFWFGRKVGTGLALLSCALYLPHVVFQWKTHLFHNPDHFLEMIMFVVVGFVVGALSDIERRHTRDLERQSTTLLQLDQRLRQADRLASIGELSAGLAHQLRNPMGSIKGTAEIIRDGMDEGHSLREFASIMVKEADRLNGIIDKFLLFARQPHQAGDSFAPGVAVKSALSRVQERCDAQGVVIKGDFSPSLPTVRMDEVLFGQVLQNLLDNALQAMKEGGTLTMTLKPCTLENPYPSPGVEISIADTGPGIPREHLERVGTPFFTTRKDGVGLGLAICHRIVTAFQGTLTLESDGSSGTTVKVRIPS